MSIEGLNESAVNYLKQGVKNAKANLVKQQEELRARTVYYEETKKVRDDQARVVESIENDIRQMEQAIIQLGGSL